MGFQEVTAADGERRRPRAYADKERLGQCRARVESPPFDAALGGRINFLCSKCVTLAARLRGRNE